jgi:hypothetical protein
LHYLLVVDEVIRICATAVDPEVGYGNEAIPSALIEVELHPIERPATAALACRPIKHAGLGAPLGLVGPAPSRRVVRAPVEHLNACLAGEGPGS